MNAHSGAGRDGNPWNINNIHQTCTVAIEKKKTMNQIVQNKFQKVQQQMLKSVQKHLQQECASSSDEEELDSEPILHEVMKDYSTLPQAEGLEKIRQILEQSFQSGAASCLICISSIKRLDAIWSCLKCYEFFHIICIQKWSKDSVFQRKEAQEDLPAFRRSNTINWACPKCRHEYGERDIPQKYFCFCGKMQNPPYQPFLVPHSCGERCDRKLKPECGHHCLLLCHPGPCPPCPKMVEVMCYCKKQGPKIQRCNNKFWSCGSKCGLPLLCKKHVCQDPCHAGDCSPCNRKSLQECNCGLHRREQPCMNPVWQCEKVCGKPFGCGYHDCVVKCHSGDCGDCPKSKDRTCPCGKSVYRLPCTVEVPTCNETCSKLLDCKVHYCSQKCHKDNCGLCREIVMKSCRCGHYKKELPCQKEFLCESKCKKMKNCLRHSCNRKCCDSYCPPCEKICGRTLSCGNHKCPAVCHRGPCYPCPEIVDVTCRCGKTCISVPCGQKKKTKPPKCNALCVIPPVCHHSSSVPHRCHFGECPPCKQICDKVKKTCNHKCPAVCHSAVWQEITKNASNPPSGPWDAFQTQMKRCNLPCPDCLVPMPVTCLGGHETVNRPCFESSPKPCSRSCGRLLKCENHLCEKQCHKVTGSRDTLLAGDNCAVCESYCVKKRPDECTHSCTMKCHPGECPPCDQFLKLKCHCGICFLFSRCKDYVNADEKTKETLKSCQSPCPKNYACGHRCLLNCHSGKCPEPDQCKKKVKVFCICGGNKKDVPCYLVRSGGVKTVECGISCLKKLEKKQEKVDEAIKKRDEGLRRTEELKKAEIKFQVKKRGKKWKNSTTSLDEDQKESGTHVQESAPLFGSYLNCDYKINFVNHFFQYLFLYIFIIGCIICYCCYSIFFS